MHTKETIESARELKGNGLNLSQISRELGVSRSTLREWFSENKRYVRKNKPRTDDDFFTFNSKKVAENCSDAWVTVMSRKSEVEKAYAFLGTKS